MSGQSNFEAMLTGVLHQINITKKALFEHEKAIKELKSSPSTKDDLLSRDEVKKIVETSVSSNMTENEVKKIVQESMLSKSDVETMIKSSTLSESDVKSYIENRISEVLESLLVPPTTVDPEITLSSPKETKPKKSRASAKKLSKTVEESVTPSVDVDAT